MRVPIHFISGLCRSGSTLPAALLRQNPRFRAYALAITRRSRCFVAAARRRDSATPLAAARVA